MVLRGWPALVEFAWTYVSIISGSSQILHLLNSDLGIPATSYHESLMLGACSLSLAADIKSLYRVEQLYKRPDLMMEFLRFFIFSHHIESSAAKCTDGCQRIVADGTKISLVRTYTEGLQLYWRPGIFNLQNFLSTNYCQIEDRVLIQYCARSVGPGHPIKHFGGSTSSERSFFQPTDHQLRTFLFELASGSGAPLIEFNQWSTLVEDSNVRAFIELRCVIEKSCSISSDTIIVNHNLRDFLKALSSRVAPVVSLLPFESVTILEQLQSGIPLTFEQENCLYVESPVFYKFYRHILGIDKTFLVRR